MNLRALTSSMFRRKSCPVRVGGAPRHRLKLRHFVPLAGFVLPTAVIGYGFVIPRSCIAGINDLTIGFATTIVAQRSRMPTTRWCLMRRPEFIARQSSHPTGVLGRIIATIMSYETSALNKATLSALGLAHTDHVLEIGFGHGRALEWAAGLLTQGEVVGIDSSQTMLDMATRRCRKLIASGRVRVDCGDGRVLPYSDACFDAVYSVHTIYFWKDPVQQLREIHRVLKPSGRLGLGFRSSGATDATQNFPESVYTFRSADDVKALLEQHHFHVLDVAACSPPEAGFVVLTAQRA
jgi:SAM-dependent methyltransferase